MKRISSLLLITLALCAPSWSQTTPGPSLGDDDHVPQSAESKGIANIAVGWSDKMGISLSLDPGGRDQTGHNTALAPGFFLASGQPAPSDTLDYPAPHNDVYPAETYRSISGGLYLVESIPVTRYVYLRGLAGFGLGITSEVVQSRVTGWYYEQDSSLAVDGMLGGGLRISPRGDSFSFGADYDTLRGISVSMSSKW